MKSSELINYSSYNVLNLPLYKNIQQYPIYQAYQASIHVFKINNFKSHQQRQGIYVENPLNYAPSLYPWYNSLGSYQQAQAYSPSLSSLSHPPQLQPTCILHHLGQPCSLYLGSLYPIPLTRHTNHVLHQVTSPFQP